MKKTVITLILAAFGLAATAQHDTLPYYVGLPYFYMDHQLRDSLQDIRHDGVTCTPLLDQFPYFCDNRTINEGLFPIRSYTSPFDDMAWGFYPDSVLHVIGIAMVLGHPMGNSGTHNYNFYEELRDICDHTNLFTDSVIFRLYIPSGANMTLARSVYLDSTFDTARCRFYSLNELDYSHFSNGFNRSFERWSRISIPAIVDLYFDSEIDLTDSFYISCTTVNTTDSGMHRYFDIFTWSEWHVPTLDHYLFPKQSYRTRNGESTPDDPWEYGELHLYPLIWPIIRRDCDTCPTPQWMQHFQSGSNLAFFRWQRTAPQVGWQLSYGPAGTAPEDGTIIDYTQPMSGIIEFEPGVEYVAYARGRCRFARFEYGPWSAPYTFTIGDAGIAAALPDSAVDLTPNPASGEVTVRCSERMTLLELFNTAGDKVFSQQLSTFHFPLSTSNFPAGTYLVRIVTEQGIATRKLVVR